MKYNFCNIAKKDKVNLMHANEACFIVLRTEGVFNYCIRLWYEKSSKASKNRMLLKGLPIQKVNLTVKIFTAATNIYNKERVAIFTTCNVTRVAFDCRISIKK